MPKVKYPDDALLTGHQEFWLESPRSYADTFGYFLPGRSLYARPKKNQARMKILSGPELLVLPERTVNIYLVSVDIDIEYDAP